MLVDAGALGAGEVLVLRLRVGQAADVDEAGVDEGRAQGLLVVEEGVAPVAKGVVDHQRSGVSALVGAEGLGGPVDVPVRRRVGAAGAQRGDALEVGRGDADPPAGCEHAGALAHVAPGLERHVLDDVLGQHAMDRGVGQGKRRVTSR